MSERLCPTCAHAVPTGDAFCGACGGQMPRSGVLEQDDGLTGRVLDGRFRVLRLLGSGGMGSVYLAEHVGIGKQVAVKVLRQDLRLNPQVVGRFRREGMAVSRLTDAHTITVFDFGVWKGLIYLVMEYLPGEDLGRILDREGRILPMRALRIARQICSSLAEAHAIGIIHRDLKPENIFVTRTASGEERVKVLDFGLAKVLADNTSGFETQHGVVMGTPSYMAPEQVSAEAVDARADLYGLGVLLFRMLTGELPFVGKTPLEVIRRRLEVPPPTFAQVCPDGAVLPGEALVQRLLAKEPAKRPKTALAVAEELGALIEQLTLSESISHLPALSDTVREPKLPGGDGHPAPNLDVLGRDEFAAYERRLRWRSRLSVLGLLAVFLGAGAWAYTWYTDQATPSLTTELEPNDDPPVANRIGLEHKVSAYLGKRRHADQSDRDVFEVQIPGGEGCLAAQVSGVKGMDVLVEAFDDQGLRLGFANRAGVGEGERLALCAARARLYWVVREVWVDGKAPSENSTDPYQIEVRAVAPSEVSPQPDAAVPDGSVPDASPVDAAPTRRGRRGR